VLKRDIIRAFTLVVQGEKLLMTALRYTTFYMGLAFMLIAGCQTMVNPSGPATISIPTAAPTLTPMVVATTPTAPVTRVAGGFAAPGTVLADQTLDLSIGQTEGDFVAFEALAGQVIRVEVLPSGNPVRYDLVLIDRFGTALALVNLEPGQAAIPVTELSLPYDGEYRVVLTAIEGTGSVQVVVSAGDRATGGSEAAKLPVHASGEVEPGAYHLYHFPLLVGQPVTIEAVASGAVSSELKITLIGPDGRISASPATSDDMQGHKVSLHGFTALASGTYIAVISTLDRAVARYTFAVTSDTEPPTPEGPPGILYNQPYRANFSDQSILKTSFDGVVGDVISVDIGQPPKELDIDIYLYSPFGQVIAFAITSPAGEGEVITEAQLPYTGRYTLELRPTGSGETSFQVIRMRADAATGGGSFGSSEAGQRTGVFAERNAFHMYQFNGTAGNHLTIVVAPVDETLDIALSLIGPAGLQIAFDGSIEPGESEPKSMHLTLTQTGNYTLIIYSLDGSFGSYDLEFTRE
jgi:hypothetical protein